MGPVLRAGSKIAHHGKHTHIRNVVLQTNTFQIVLTTDGKQTFVIFKYGIMSWSRARNTDSHAMVS